MKKTLLLVLLFLFINPVSIGANSSTYDTAVNQIESISSSSNQFTDFIYIVELSNIVLENHEGLSNEELERIETLMMTRIHERFEPLYRSYFKSIESTDGAYQIYFNDLIKAEQNPFRLMRQNAEIQNAIQSQTGE